MRTLRAVIEYDGTSYSGYQAQAGRTTIQGTIEKAIAEMTGEQLRLRAASRTDSGVHARGQVVAFDTGRDRIPLHGFQRGLNSLLPRDIVIRSIEEAEAGYHPRSWARGKHYRYTIWRDEGPTALDRNRVWWVRERLDLPAMQAAAALYLGTHDFESFRAAGCPAKHAVRTMYAVSMGQGARSSLVFDVVGNAFCRNMVRIMVGTVVDVGRGKKTQAEVEIALQSRDRALAGITAPPDGLCLEEVIFDERLPEKPRSLPAPEVDDEA
ncbi:MAG: tRNA pseudouridine(38-40) synthase TruA [Myxococcota bacterium]